MATMSVSSLPGSREAILAAAPAWIVEPEKVYDCPRHSHVVTGGLGYSAPYSCWTPLCNGCSIGEDEKPENRKNVLMRHIKNYEARIAVQRVKMGVDESFNPPYQKLDYTHLEEMSDPKKEDEKELALLLWCLEGTKRDLAEAEREDAERE